MNAERDRLGELPANSATRAYPIGSVDNTLRITLLPRDRGTLTPAQLPDELGSRARAHRLMAMLTLYDFVRQHPADCTFRIGLALIDLSLAVPRSLDLRVLARPALDRLARSTGMTAHLALPRGRSVVFADSVEAPQTMTERSVTSLQTLLAAIATIRDSDAINRNESEPWILSTGIACTVPEADIVADFTVAGPDSALTESWEERTAQELRRAATEPGEQIRTYNL